MTVGESDHESARPANDTGYHPRLTETLNLGSLGVGLGTLLLRDDLATDDELANVVVLGQVEEAANLGRTLLQGEEGLSDCLK